MNSRFSRFVSVLFLLVVTGATAAQETTRDLFDGETLDGWVKRGGKATYEVVDGAIVGTSAPNTQNTFLCTEDSFADFVLTYEFKCDSELNSGVQIRSECFEEAREVTKGEFSKKIPAGRVHGYQVEIDPNSPDRYWMAGVYDEARRAWLFPGKLGGDGSAFTEQGTRLYKPLDWNQVRVECRGDHIRTWLNGEPRSDFHDDMTLQGFIGLQVHGVGWREEPLQVAWRNIKIQVLKPAAN